MTLIDNDTLEQAAIVADTFARKYRDKFMAEGGLFADQQTCYAIENVAANIRALKAKESNDASV